MDLNKPQKVNITVIICTRNRASQLSSVLDSACRLTVPSGLVWEFIVVDNGSSDNTSKVVSGYADRLPIRCIREENPGLSNARNCGVASAEGQYICWTDDDVLIDPGWLAAYASAFKRHPEASVFGGKVIPFLEKPTPAWFEKYKNDWPLTSLLAHRDFGDDVIPLSFVGIKIPWGANFAVRTSEQKLHRYNPDLGVSPKHRRVGEETDVIYHIFKSGGHGWWVPESKVTHIIPTKRQTLRYLYEYSFLGGETVAYVRDCHSSDNYTFALEEVPDEYRYGKIILSFQLALHVLKLAVALVINHKSKLSHVSRIGCCAGALSYRKQS